MNKKIKKILLIDANSFIHRSFHALPPLETPEGKPIGAIYGLTNTLLKVIRDEKPNYVAAAFDTPKKTFRSDIFEEYKAHRPETPDELKQQIVEAYNLFKAFGIKTIEKEGFEGDDVLGTLAKKFTKENGVKTFILSGDLDILQLVNDKNTIVLTPKRKISEMKRYNEEKVKERFGVPPHLLPDYKGLVGDSSDNIPGIYGVGPKTAEKLLSKYKTIENLYKNIDQEKESAVIKKIKNNKPKAILSKKLATIKKDVSLKISLDQLKYSTNNDQLIKYLKSLGFKTLVKRLEKKKEKKNYKFPKNTIIINSNNLEKKKLKNNQTKVAYEWKKIYKKAIKKNIEIKKPIFDIKIAAWLLNPDNKKISLENITEKLLDTNPKKYKERIKKLYPILKNKIKENNLQKIYQEIEIPLIEILAEIEKNGIKININLLKDVENKIQKEINEIKNKIYNEAGEEFNIKSPRQVGEILFEKLNLKNNHSKTSTGQYRTSENVLNEIKDQHPIIKLILKHRELIKIKTTYITPIIEKTDKNNRLKTTLSQTATGTGRLASEKPNLQNIPKGSKWSRLLRECFIAQKDWSLVSFDYSQMELRILAHVTKDKKLTKIFKEGKDIHTTTASKILNKKPEEITKEDRRLAKTLNFGIIYGMGSRAFSKQSGLSTKKSKEFIKKYFKDFNKVKEWQEKIKKETKKKGYVKNLKGRIRKLENNWQTERAAINMPIQSLEADIIKEGMIKTYNYLKKENLINNKVKILLSIHDELLLEISNDILSNVIPKIKNILEKDVTQLSVPLIVDVLKGDNWNNMKKYKINND